MSARAWLLTLFLALSAGACGKDSPEEPGGWFTRVVPPETTVAGVRILLEVDDLGLTPQDVGAAGEVPSSLRTRGTDYELDTVNSKDIRGLSGSTLRVAREGSEWRASVVGTWCS